MIPGIEFTDEGIIAPSREEVTAGLWDMMRAAFGSNLNEDARTPQGQLVTSLTAIIRQRDDASIALANNFDPRYAVGQFQEALAAVYFLTRKTAVPSVAQLEFIGVTGTLIPQGFVVIDDSDRRWVTSRDIAIGDGLVDARCETPGPIQAAADTITTPLESIPGLDRVTNPSPAAAGSAAESRLAFEMRRYESVAANSWGMNRSVRGAVDNLPRVIDTYVIDNPTDSTITVGSTNYPMIRNSLLVSVVGGDDHDIAGAILKKGGTGCAFEGNTEVLYVDEETGNVNHPEYLVRFLRPDHITLSVRLTVIDADSISFQNTEKAKQHIVTSLQSGDYRTRIGGMLVGANYICGLDNQVVRPVRIELSTDGVTWLDSIQFGVDQFPVISIEDVSVVSL